EICVNPHSSAVQVLKQVKQSCHIEFGEVPPGTPENSPPIYRWVACDECEKSRQGRKKRDWNRCNGNRSDGKIGMVNGRVMARDISFVPAGTFAVFSFYPPINRWAIFWRPSGTNQILKQSCPLYYLFFLSS